MSSSGARAQVPSAGFRSAVVLAVLLTVPAVYLVGRGDLSAHDALVRFGCAWAFAAGGVGLLLSTVGGTSVPAAATALSPAADSEVFAHAGDLSGGREGAEPGS